MGKYLMEAKRSLLDWAADHSEALTKWGERTKYAAVATGAGSYALMNSLGVTDPDTQSRLMVVPAAIIFAAGEGAKCLGEYAAKVRNGEVDPVRNAGYIARVAAPLYAIGSGADGRFSPVNDFIAPIASWVGGMGLSRAGQARINKGKKKAAERLYGHRYHVCGESPRDIQIYMLRKAGVIDPSDGTKAVETAAANMPLDELKGALQDT